MRHGRTGNDYTGGLARLGNKDMQRLLIFAGLALVIVGLGWPSLRKLPLGRLPGDIHIVREGFSFHFPIVTCIVVSLVVSLIFWIFRR
jgi:hypothetical protein